MSARPVIPADARRALGLAACQAGELTAQRFFAGNRIADGDTAELSVLGLSMLCATAAHLALAKYLSEQKESGK